jgi:hypothetical protein
MFSRNRKLQTPQGSKLQIARPIWFEICNVSNFLLAVAFACICVFGTIGIAGSAPRNLAAILQYCILLLAIINSIAFVRSWMRNQFRRAEITTPERRGSFILMSTTAITVVALAITQLALTLTPWERRFCAVQLASLLCVCASSYGSFIYFYARPLAHHYEPTSLRKKQPPPATAELQSTVEGPLSAAFAGQKPTTGSPANEAGVTIRSKDSREPRRPTNEPTLSSPGEVSSSLGVNCFSI